MRPSRHSNGSSKYPSEGTTADGTLVPNLRSTQRAWALDPARVSEGPCECDSGILRVASVQGRNTRHLMLRKKSKALERYIEGLQAAVDSFRPGAQNQWERDRFVVEEYLVNAGVPYAEADLKRPSSDPPDVVFQAAQFEVKEILDKDRFRHAEYKKLLSKAQAATTMRGLGGTLFTPKDLAISTLLRHCEEIVASYANRYDLRVKASLDLLIYVNLSKVFSLVTDCPLSSEHIAGSGWRSVSFVKGSYCGTIHASPSAPGFIRQLEGRVDHRWNHEPNE